MPYGFSRKLKKCFEKTMRFHSIDEEVTDKTGEKGYYGLLFRFLISCDGSRHKNAVIWQDRFIGLLITKSAVGK